MALTVISQILGKLHQLKLKKILFPYLYCRYMFYDVNPPEGFNLRRDVYMRFAIFARKLSKSSDPKLHNFQLVLPPWSNLHHWKHTEEPEHLPWSLFFDLGSLQKFSPVIEMHQFFTSMYNNY